MRLLRRNMQKSVTTDGEAQLSHYVVLARENSKQLENRSLLLIVPLFISTIAITTSLKPHLDRIDGTLRRLEAQEAKVQSLQNAEREALDEAGFERGKKAFEHRKLDDQLLKLVRARETQSAVSSRLRLDVARAIKHATVDVSVPGTEKVKLPLFYAAAIIQISIIGALLYLAMIRRSTFRHLRAAAYSVETRILTKHQAVAGPGCSFLLPLPREDCIRRLLLGGKAVQITNWIPVTMLMTCFVMMSVWLFYINSRVADLVDSNASLDYLPFVFSAMSAALTLALVVNWFLPQREIEISTVARRRIVLITASAVVGGFAFSSAKPAVRRLLGSKANQLFHKLKSPRPRYRHREHVKMTTDSVRDGFLFNPRSGKYHLVVGGRVISVHAAPFQQAAFARFAPISLSDTMSYPSSASSAAHGLGTIAIERNVTTLLAEDPRAAMDLLCDFIRSRLPNAPPSKSSALDLRLFDLYAKLCIMYFDSKRLEEFVEALQTAHLGFLVADRLERWSDPKNKWRKRVLNYGRCSNVGYPVVGRCGFESRPTALSRSKHQWFNQTTPNNWRN